MPQRKSASSLVDLSSRRASELLLIGCETTDKLWEPPPRAQPTSSLSPLTSPVKSQAGPEIPADITRNHEIIRTWLSNLPNNALENVVKDLLDKVEQQLLEDKDKKLIMALINIESMRMNDFFFGVHSLLTILRGRNIANIHFSKRLWYCLFEYEEITSGHLLSDTLCENLPHLTSLVKLDLSHVASDRLLAAISRSCTHLRHLSLSHGSVTDRGIRSICGVSLSSSSSSPGRFRDVSGLSPSPGCFRNLNDVFDMEQTEIHTGSWKSVAHSPYMFGRAPFSPPRQTTSVARSPGLGLSSSPGPARGGQGCHRLEHLDLQSCYNITELSVWTCLETLARLKTLLYHEKLSVFEILIRKGSVMSEEARARTKLMLRQLEHGFPYGLSPPIEQMDVIISLCPYITSINMVTEDRCLPILSQFPHLSRLTVELEDCVGDGLVEFLSVAGGRLEELVVSCSSDPDSTLHHVEGGGQQGQLFNTVILLAGDMCPQVKKLSISGCGLVSSVLVEKFEVISKIANKLWLMKQSLTWFKCLESIVLMSYEDTPPATTVHPSLLRSLLQAAKKIAVLSLEGNFGSFFNDSYLIEIFRTNPLEKLRILDISETGVAGHPGRIPLSLRAAKAILEQCSFLEELRISDWSVNETEFEEIKKLVTTNNWNLHLTRKSG